MSHFEISPREREDEQRRHRDEFDLPNEDYDDYLKRYTQPEARLSGLPEAGDESPSRIASAMTPGTGSPENRDERAA